MKEPDIEQMIAEINAEALRVRREHYTAKYGPERAEELILQSLPGCTRIVLDGEKDEHEQTIAYMCNPTASFGRRWRSDAG